MLCEVSLSIQTALQQTIRIVEVACEAIGRVVRRGGDAGGCGGIAQRRHCNAIGILADGQQLGLAVVGVLGHRTQGIHRFEEAATVIVRSPLAAVCRVGRRTDAVQRWIGGLPRRIDQRGRIHRCCIPDGSGQQALFVVDVLCQRARGINVCDLATDFIQQGPVPLTSRALRHAQLAIGVIEVLGFTQIRHGCSGLLHTDQLSSLVVGLNGSQAIGSDYRGPVAGIVIGVDGGLPQGVGGRQQPPHPIVGVCRDGIAGAGLLYR